ncbi:DUF6157 family protein [Sphaerisporangium fuscum]|uniref:DUF6157 family protein n=1 Tax=Sphaerisporangium fuscum TaxID=2835868 RepID=UPI001BDC13B4|nr:DUF6157 family protein [Sphaerisporangium fuscum]
MDLNYYRTLIAVADDCPVTESVVPEARGAKQTIATVQYELLAGEPYVHTQEDVLFETWLRRQDLPGLSEQEIARLRDEFFGRSQACLRASPLPKKYGWGLAFDDKGRVALCPMESKEYQDLLADDGVTVLKALRSRRA